MGDTRVPVTTSTTWATMVLTMATVSVKTIFHVLHYTMGKSTKMTACLDNEIMCVCICVCARACAFTCECERRCVCVCKRAYAHVCASARTYVFVDVNE